MSRKTQVVKRLSQCLNPAHPTGVHQKALEVYDQIFGMVDPAYLEANIEILTFGLFTFFKYTSMSVKPFLLAIFEKHFIFRDSTNILCSLMENLIGSLLIGLEEPNEFLEKCTELLWKIEARESKQFFNSFWSVLAKFSQCRLGGLNFVLKVKGKFFQQMLPIKDSIDYDIICIAINNCLLEEKDSLVVRHALDVACCMFPIATEETRQQEWFVFTREQQKLFIRSILTCLLKRNFSLTRRVYNWVQGVGGEEGTASVTSASLTATENGSSSESITPISSSLSKYTEELVKECFSQMLNVQNCNEISILLLPYKIMGYFLDRSDVSLEILRSLFMQFLMKAHENYSQYGEEYLAGVNRLFSLVNLELAWNEIFNYLASSVISLNIDLIEFILNKTAMIDQEAKSLFVPNLLLLLLSKNTTDCSLIYKVVNQCDFQREYDHSLVIKGDFKVTLTQSVLYSTCLFHLLKYSLNFDGQLNFVVQLLLKGVTVVNFDGLENDLALGETCHVKRLKLILLKYDLLVVADRAKFIQHILSDSSDELDIIQDLQSIYPNECEKFFLVQFKTGKYSIERLIWYWNEFTEHQMLLTTCLLLETVNSKTTQLSPDESAANQWIMSEKLTFKKLYFSLLNLLSLSDDLEQVRQQVCSNGRQVLYALEKIHQIFKLRKENFYWFLSQNPVKIPHLNGITEKVEALSLEKSNSHLKEFLQIILNIFQVPFQSSFVDIYKELIFLLYDLFTQLDFDEYQDILEGLINKIIEKLNTFLEPVLFSKILFIVFPLVKANLNQVTPLLVFDPFLKDIYQNSICLSEYCYFIIAFYQFNPSESLSSSIENVLRDLLSIMDEHGRLQNLFPVTLLTLFLANGCSLNNLPILNGLFERLSLTSSLLIDYDRLNSYISNVESYINSTYKTKNSSTKKGTLNGQLFLKLMEYAFLSDDSRLDYLLLSCYVIDTEAFMECFLRFWSSHIYKNEANLVSGSRVVEKINFYSNLQLMNHNRNLSLTLSLCLFNKKNSTFSVMISESIGLDYLLVTFSCPNWKPSDTSTLAILGSLRDFFDSNRGRFTFIGCKFFIFITNYILLSGFGDKKILRESQDCLVKILLIATNKMSKLISSSLKKTFLRSSSGTTGTLEESNEYFEMEQMLNFFSLHLFTSIDLLGRENERVPEFMNRFVNEIILPLIGYQLPIGWTCIDSILKVDNWIKFWKKELSVDYFSGNRDFFRSEHVSTKTKLLSTAWTHNGSAIESERLADWISGRLILPLPSNVNMLFMNRESEFIARCENIHQISAIIFSCPKNHFSRAFPLLNEKIVESFRVLEKCNVHSEILLLVKVILLRFELSVISNFFPVLFNELYGILQLVPDISNFSRSDSPDIFCLIYRTCQVLDLLYTINNYEFQSYFGIFFAPDSKSGFLDHWKRIYERATEYSVDGRGKQTNSATIDFVSREKKRPFLTDRLDKLNCLFDVLPFLFKHCWKEQRDSLGCNLEVDYEFINQLITDELYYQLNEK